MRMILPALFLACGTTTEPVCPSAQTIRVSGDGIDVRVTTVADDAGAIHLLVHSESRGIVGIRDHLLLQAYGADGGRALRSESTSREDAPDAKNPVYAPFDLPTITKEVIDKDVVITR